jgi:hypothetical protein
MPELLSKCHGATEEPIATPRSDAVLPEGSSAYSFSKMRDFARQLERELILCQKERDMFKAGLELIRHLRGDQYNKDGNEMHRVIASETLQPKGTP